MLNRNAEADQRWKIEKLGFLKLRLECVEDDRLWI